MSKAFYPRPRKHTFNTAAYFIHCVFGDDGMKVKMINDTTYYFYKNGEMIAFFEEISGDLWTTVQ